MGGIEKKNNIPHISFCSFAVVSCTFNATDLFTRSCCISTKSGTSSFSSPTNPDPLVTNSFGVSLFPFDATAILLEKAVQSVERFEGRSSESLTQRPLNSNRLLRRRLVRSLASLHDRLSHQDLDSLRYRKRRPSEFTRSLGSRRKRPSRTAIRRCGSEER